MLIRSDVTRSWGGEESEAALVIGHEIGRAVLHARLYERERELNGELQELDRYKGELISTITHELKTPLTTILGHAELLEETPAPQDSVRAIARNAERLQTLAEDLLLLAKVKDPHRPMIAVPVDVSALVRDTHDLFDLLARRREVALLVDDGVGTGSLHAHGDRDELERALINVVGNALKYTPTGGSVHLAVHTDGADVVFTCRDTGLGIAEDDHDTLFDEFNRSSNPDAQARPGSGLGLAIVKRIVDRHRGTITLESTLGEGSTFRIAVPVAGPERVLSGPTPACCGSPRRSGPLTGGNRPTSSGTTEQFPRAPGATGPIMATCPRTSPPCRGRGRPSGSRSGRPPPRTRRRCGRSAGSRRSTPG